MLDFPSPMIPYTVYVSCKTYNQSEYILEAMNGFCIQKTNFPFICAIFDDASTDGEQKVIRKYIDDNFELFEESASYQTETDYAYISYARHKINTNCHFVVFYLKNNHYSNPQKYAGKKEEYVKDWMCDCKYEAICEGDDYWTDPLKLQKQVDYLENHKNCTLCVSEADILTSNGLLSWQRYSSSRVVDIKDIILGGGLWFQTATYIFKVELLNDMPECGLRCHVGDYPLMIWAALKGDVYYLYEKTSVYRYATDNGWTKKVISYPLDKKILGWRSEIDMLLGFNEYSEGKYADSFYERIRRYLYSILISNPSEIDAIRGVFCDICHLLSFSDKIDLFLLQNNMNLIFRIVKKIRTNTFRNS